MEAGRRKAEREEPRSVGTGRRDASFPAGSEAPNRALKLAELDRSPFRRVLAELERLLEVHPDLYLHPSKRWEYPWALEQSSLRSGARVLDAGCGSSVFPFYLARLGYRTVAADLRLPEGIGGDAPRESPGGASAHSAPPAYARGGLTALPFAAASFDGVFCISVIEHLPRVGVQPALAELRRVLRPGGRLLLTTDFYEDADAEIWHEGPDGRFRVEWELFDEEGLREHLLGAPGFRLVGELDLDVQWEETRPRMRRFHGYPYTSVGLTLERVGPPVAARDRGPG